MERGRKTSVLNCWLRHSLDIGRRKQDYSACTKTRASILSQKFTQKNVWHLPLPKLTEASELLNVDQNLHWGQEPRMKAGVPWASMGSPTEQGDLAHPVSWLLPSTSHSVCRHSRTHLSLPASLTGNPRANLKAVDSVTRVDPKPTGTVRLILLAVKLHASENVTLLSLSTVPSLPVLAI